MLKVDVHWQYGDKQGTDNAMEVAFEVVKGQTDAMQPLFKRIIKEVLEPAVRKQFETEGAFLGGPWEELASETVRRRKGSSHPILRDPEHDKRKHRKEDLFSTFLKGGDEHVEEIDRTVMRWGSASRYAPLHQTGTDKMPARPILVITEPMKQQITELVKEFIAEAAVKAGFAVPGYAARVE